MSIFSLKQAFDLIDSTTNKLNFVKSLKSANLLIKAENIIKIKFPKSYYSFLLNYGTGSAGATEIYGVIDDDFENSGIPDVVWLHIENAKDPEFPKNLLQIADVGDGFYYYLDSSKPDENGEYPVVIWGHGLKPEQAEIVYEDFGAFLLDQVKQALEYQD